MNMITDALAHHEAGRLAEAESIYRELLDRNPNNSDALHWLGVIAHQIGDNISAKDLIEKAININNSDGSYCNHLGMVLKGLKNYKEAIDAYRKCLEITPNNAEAYNNLGNVHQIKCELNKALNCYHEALQIKPSLIEAVKNIGDVFKKQAKFDRAIVEYEKAVRLNPDSYTGQDAALTLAVFNYLNSDFESAEKYLQIAKVMNGGITKATLSSITYWNYLTLLIRWWSKSIKSTDGNSRSSATEECYVIGESHSLSLNKLCLTINGKSYCPKIFWIEGIKQWHLSNSEKNIYKYQIVQSFRRIKKNGTVLLTVGEIDCRINEGIFRLWQKKGGSIEVIIENTVTNYLKFIRRLSITRKAKVIIFGVPASNAYRKDTSENVLALFGKFLEIYNLILKNSALSMGFSFVDVFRLTNAGHGFADGSLHLDSHHLNPSTMKKAIEEFLITPDDYLLNSNYLKGNHMTTITIDNKEYDFDKLSDEAKAQLVSLQFCDQELQRLQVQAAAYQTARMAYAKALNEALTPAMGEKISFN